MQRVLSLVSIKETYAPKILSKLRLYPDLYQTILEQNTIILANKSGKSK